LQPVETQVFEVLLDAQLRRIVTRFRQRPANEARPTQLLVERDELIVDDVPVGIAHFRLSRIRQRLFRDTQVDAQGSQCEPVALGCQRVVQQQG